MNTELESHAPPPNGAVPCPICAAEIRFWDAAAQGGVFPHFYCDTCSNVYWSHADWVRAQSNQDRTAALAEIVASLPPCPCGGRFVPGSNPACPTCGARIPHQDDPAERLFDPHAIVVEGARLLTPARD